MTAALTPAVLGWYEASARELPWRRPEAGPWAVLVSEVMLQQTPVTRVLPAYRDWLARWPTPASLAAASPADAVRQWGRLGYPRRAVRLHAAAGHITRAHGGQVPSALADLLTLPGVGGYTAAAVASFAFGQSHPVLDTNVRRVLARLLGGKERPAPAVSTAEIALARSVLPAADQAPRWSVALMELGALVCTSAQPRCDDCPVAAWCLWRRAGKPADPGPRRKSQRYEGTDRQCRGRLLAVLRESSGPVPAAILARAWAGETQRVRALASLISDDLVERISGDRYALRGDHRHVS